SSHRSPSLDFLAAKTNQPAASELASSALAVGMALEVATPRSACHHSDLPAPARCGRLPARYAAASVEDHRAASDAGVDVIPHCPAIERELADRLPDRIRDFGARHAAHDAAPACAQFGSLIRACIRCPARFLSRAAGRRCSFALALCLEGVDPCTQSL